jgi:hypothetical protein
VGKTHFMSDRFRPRALGAALIVCAGVLGTVAGTTNAGAATAVVNRSANRSSFGGYFATPSGLSSVSADFTVPAVTCSTVKPQDLVTVVLIGGNGVNTQAGANSDCQRGSPIYSAGGGAGLVTFHLPVSPGDLISVTASQTASGASVTETDMTTSLTATASAPGATATKAEIGNVFNRESVSIPTFSSESFSASMIDGSALGSGANTGTDMKGKHKKVLISTSALSPDGTSFTTTFVSH